MVAKKDKSKKQESKNLDNQKKKESKAELKNENKKKKGNKSKYQRTQPLFSSYINKLF